MPLVERLAAVVPDDDEYFAYALAKLIDYYTKTGDEDRIIQMLIADVS